MPPKPPPKQITSLKQIDISKLDVKDLQNIDYQKLLKDLRQRPDTAISFAVPVIALFISFNIFSGFQSEQKKLSNDLYEMKEKIKLLDEYKASQVELDKFTKSLPAKITENEFINKVTDTAVKNNIQIESYTPGQSRNDTRYELNTINLAANALDFKDMTHFIAELETAGLPIRINSWSGTLGQRTQTSASRRSAQTGNSNEQVVNFRLDISSVSFKL